MSPSELGESYGNGRSTNVNPSAPCLSNYMDRVRCVGHLDPVLVRRGLGCGDCRVEHDGEDPPSDRLPTFSFPDPVDPCPRRRVLGDTAHRQSQVGVFRRKSIVSESVGFITSTLFKSANEIQ